MYEAEVVSGWEPVSEFVANRGRLFGVAYRMLGSAADAEDLVQDAYLRWMRADHADIDAPAAWLVKTVTNLCLNQLGSARVRREQYVGPWLPEPVCTADGALGPMERAEQRESVSLALLVLLERLTPAERAVFVLREAFGYDHRSIAEILDTTPGNARQLHSRATKRVRQGRPRFDPDRGAWRDLVERFIAAARDGDVAELERMLANDVVATSDGGGKATAGRRPVLGRERVARLAAGLLRKAGGVTLEVIEVNGEYALLGRVGDHVLGVWVVHIAEGEIVALQTVANPDKLGYLQCQLLAGLSHS